MSLNLEYDNQSHVQEHLNELTARVTLVLFLSSLFTIFWLYQIDSMLDSALRYLNPCPYFHLNPLRRLQCYAEHELFDY